MNIAASFVLPRRWYSRLKLKEIERKWREIEIERAERGETVKSTISNTTPALNTSNTMSQCSNYVLPMFPYPSGNLHMGHVRVYSISDCLARFNTLLSSASSVVLHPIGWDAFGLPAENAAMAAKIQPSAWTSQNISTMRAQLHSLGYNFNWSAELETCDPRYYQWTQWLFLEMYQRGWAYRAEAPVSWDPVDKTVLAAEQVDSAGRSWRSGALVQKRMLSQWYLRITDFAEDLLEGLEELEWPDAVKEMQRNWIGKTEGAFIKFPLENSCETLTSTRLSYALLHFTHSLTYSHTLFSLYH